MTWQSAAIKRLTSFFIGASDFKFDLSAFAANSQGQSLASSNLPRHLDLPTCPTGSVLPVRVKSGVGLYKPPCSAQHVFGSPMPDLFRL